MLLIRVRDALYPYDEEAREEFATLRNGDFSEVTYVKLVDMAQHRKFFKMIDAAYHLWQEQSDRKRANGIEVQRMTKVGFRKSVTIRAGYFQQWFDFEGKMHIDAITLRPDTMKDAYFRKCYSDIVNTLMRDVLDDTNERAILAVLELAPDTTPETTG